MNQELLYATFETPLGSYKVPIGTELSKENLNSSEAFVKELFAIDAERALVREKSNAECALVREKSNAECTLVRENSKAECSKIKEETNKIREENKPTILKSIENVSVNLGKPILSLLTDFIGNTNGDTDNDHDSSFENLDYSGLEPEQK